MTCTDCTLSGNVEVTSGGISKSASFWSSVTSLWKALTGDGLSGLVADATSLQITLDLSDLSGSFAFEVDADAQVSHEFTLLTLPFAGLSTLEGSNDNIGVVLVIDFIMDVDAQATFNAGFEFAFEGKASIELDPIAGTIENSEFTGVTIKALPASIEASIKFTAALRATLQVGTTLEVKALTKSEDVSFEAGLFVELVRYTGFSSSSESFTAAGGTLPSSASGNCTSVFQENMWVEMGAFAQAEASVSDLGVNFDESKANTTTVTAITLPAACL